MRLVGYLKRNRFLTYDMDGGTVTVYICNVPLLITS